MSNVTDIREATRDRVRVAMFTFAAAEADMAVATLRLCMLLGVSVVSDVTVAERASACGFIRDSLKKGVYS